MVKRSWFSVWILLCLLMVGWGANASQVDAQGPNRVGVVVRLGEGNLLTRCVEFSEAEISGYDVLDRAGLEVVRRAEGLGGIVCSIQGVGCPLDDCWCQCSGSTCTYWSYWHLAGDQWSYSTLGADAHRVRHGDVEGWNWSEGNPPPAVSFEQICLPPATPTLVPTATPTDTPLPPPSIQFWVSPTTIVAGECAELSWQVEYVRAVYLDGEGVGGSGTRSVCPTQSQTYELRVVSPSGESRHPVTVNVVQPTATPTHTPTPHPPQTATVAVQVQPSVALTETPITEKEAATEMPVPTATPTETVTPVSTATSTVTPTTTATATVTMTPTPRPVAQLPRSSSTAASVPTVRPSPTLDDQPGEGADETTNYILFGVLMAVLFGVGAVILIQRRR